MKRKVSLGAQVAQQSNLTQRPARKSDKEDDASPLPLFLQPIEKNIVHRATVADDFDVISLDQGYPLVYETKAVRGQEPALCDEKLYNRRSTYYSMDKLSDIGDERAPERRVKEILFSRETIRYCWYNNPMTFKYDPKEASREFVLVTYYGIAKYLMKVLKEHVDGNLKLDYHRLACFHEVLQYDKQPYKLYVDFEYDPKSYTKKMVIPIPPTRVYSKRQNTVSNSYWISCDFTPLTA